MSGACARRAVLGRSLLVSCKALQASVIFVFDHLVSVRTGGCDLLATADVRRVLARAMAESTATRWSSMQEQAKN